MINLEEYLAKIKKELNVSDKFIDEARPSLKLLFRDVKGKKLKETLEVITWIFKQQAGAEEISSKIKDDLVKLEDSERKLNNNLKATAIEAEKLSRTMKDSKLIFSALKNKTNIEA